MRRNKSEVYLHLIWATRNREALITPDLREAISAVIVGIAQRLGCDVLAIGGMSDHVHLVVRLSPSTSIAQLAQQVKGASSRRANELSTVDTPFSWQEGYGVFSVSRPHLKKVIAYVDHQHEHHTQGKLWNEWEETEELTEAGIPRP